MQGHNSFQTNLVYDPDRPGKIGSTKLTKRNIIDKVFILIGITPLKSLKVSQVHERGSAGRKRSDHLIKRMEARGEKS